MTPSPHSTPGSPSHRFRSREHAEALTARQAIAESRKSRGLLSGLFRRSQDLYNPTYNYVSDGSACRIYGSLAVKRVTSPFPRFVHPHSSFMHDFPLANLHITTLGHGYSSNVHVDHSRICHCPPLFPRSNVLS